MALLNQSEINSQLGQISDNWKYQENQLILNITLKDFAQNLSVVNSIGEIAELLDHHPDMLIHGWNKLRIMISTHSEGGVTEKDFTLALKVDQILNELNK